MRDDLLGFVLGALDASEHELIQQRLERDPQLREDLTRVRRSVRPLSWDQRPFEPPNGLAARTCAVVHQIADSAEQASAAGRPPATLSPASRSEWSAAPRTWTVADFVVVAGVCLAAACLLFPAIATSRHHYQRELCAVRQRDLGRALIEYSERGYFPVVPESGNAAIAGIYAPKLLEQGLVEDVSQFVCPAATGSRLVVRVPVSMREIYAARGPQLLEIYQAMGKNYAYRFPPVVNGHLQRVRNRGREHFALLADVPLVATSDSLFSNHGHGQNVLFEDGHVGFLASREWLNDDLFLNHWGLVEASLDPDDCVLAPSYSPPLPRMVPAGMTVAE